jgi:molecular chaperone GrpE
MTRHKTDKTSTTEHAEPAATGATEENQETALSKLEGDLARFKDLALRSQADFDNYRKRAAREKEDAIKYANTTFLDRLIPISDNFDLGLAAAKGSGEGASILAGLEMVAKQLGDFLADNGVQAIDAAGQPFDPNLHEAVAQEESAEVPEGNVLRQLRRGYKLRDRLLRPATVIVSKGPSAA